MYRGADKSLAIPGRKKANFLSEWREFPSAPCLAGKKIWWQLVSPCCWNRAPPWHASEFVSFLVGLRTYQHPNKSDHSLKQSELLYKLFLLLQTSAALYLKYTMRQHVPAKLPDTPQVNIKSIFTAVHLWFKKLRPCNGQLIGAYNHFMRCEETAVRLGSLKTVSLDVETRRNGNQDVICYTQFSAQELGNK